MPLTGQPPQYTRGYDYRQHSIDQPTVPQPGDKLNQDFDDISAAINGFASQVDQITDPDGSLADGIVGPNNLAPGFYDQLVDDATTDLQPWVDQAQSAAQAASLSAANALASENAADHSAQDAAAAVTTATETYQQARAFAGQASTEANRAANAANEAANSASTAQGAMSNAQDWSDQAAKWAEYLAGPVEPAPPGWPEAIDDGLWSSKWWALRAREIVGAWGSLYLGSFPAPPSPPAGQTFPPGSLYFDTFYGQMMVWDGVRWKPISAPAAASQGMYSYIAAEDQQDFSGPDLAGKSPVFDQAYPEPTDVHVNGVRLLNDSLAGGAGLGDYALDTATPNLHINAPLSAGSIVQLDLFIPPAKLAPGAVNAYKLLNLDLDPVTNEPGQFDGVRKTFPINYIDPTSSVITPATPGDGVQLQINLEGVSQEPGTEYTTSGSDITFADAPQPGTRFWGVWYKPGVSDAGGGRTEDTLGADLLLADGAQQVELPDWLPLAFGAITAGLAVTLEDPTSLRLNVSGPAIVQVHVEVLHNWGSAVVFGFSMDDEEPVELGRVIVESNEPVSVLKRYGVNLTSGRVLHLWVSSDFPWAQFAWSNGEIQLLLT